MNTGRNVTTFLLAGGVLWGCAAPRGTTESVSSANAEALYARGHDFYVTRELDSAATFLSRALAIDSTHAGALTDLAALAYDRALEAAAGARQGYLREARRYLEHLEAQGDADAGVYERLCEISATLDDAPLFVRYAQRYADRYPYDRQTYNLGIAYLEAGRFLDAVALMKKAVTTYPESAYMGGFYVLMGRAYMRVDRDQTATRTLETGWKAVDTRLAALSGGGADRHSKDRLAGDRITILRTLRQLYETYSEREKLERVVRLLREAGR